MDPYSAPESKTAEPIAGLWTRRTTAVLVGFFALINFLVILFFSRELRFFGIGWLDHQSVLVYAYVAILMLRGLAAVSYFFGYRWFYWVILLSMLLVYVVPGELAALRAINSTAAIALVLAIGLGLSRCGRQYLVPWRNTSTTTASHH